MSEQEPLAEPVELPDGELGMQMGDQLFKIRKSKPWNEMTQAERDEWLKAGTSFIMGGD